MTPSRFHTRRSFLRASAGATGAVVLSSVVPRPLSAHIGGRRMSAPPIQDPDVKALVMRAVDVAHAEGAVYADVRLTHTIVRKVGSGGTNDRETLHAGVRALYDGYWGFAAGPLWGTDEMVRLAKEAVFQSKTNALDNYREIDLAPAPVIQDGHWIMPVQTDPLLVHPLAMRDYLEGLTAQIEHDAGLDSRIPSGTVVSALASCTIVVQERAFGASNNSYCTQRVYRTSGVTEVIVGRNDNSHERRSVDLLTPAGVGWELFEAQPVREAALQLVVDICADLDLPLRPVDVGRYDVVMDALSVARLVSPTIGGATELDRALGYEANAGGTSYLTDPFAMLDTFAVGTSALSVKGNRSEPGGAATVQWDDEGVVPPEFPVITDGILRGYQTTRESAGWLKAGTPNRPLAPGSHGCAYAPTAAEAPLSHPANLVMTPGSAPLRFDDLVATVGNGIAMNDVDADVDFQKLNGYVQGRTYEIRGGKRVARLGDAGILFRTIDLWKSLIHLGGRVSERRYGLSVEKGEPEQTSYHSVTAVPAAFRNVSLVDLKRRA